VERGGVQGSSYGVAAVCAGWWARAVASLQCPDPAPPAPGVRDVVVPYLVMHPGYAYGKLQLVGAALSGIQ
jgi:hypothetical protein